MEPFNTYSTNDSCAQAYFDAVGCPILWGAPGYRYGFYYVDWDEDAPKNGETSFWLARLSRQSTARHLELSTCTSEQNTVISNDWSAFVRINGGYNAQGPVGRMHLTLAF